MAIDGSFDLAGWPVVRALARYRSELARPAPRLVDLSAGRGRDAIFLARHGYRVLAIERDAEALARGARRAARLGVPLRTRRADLATCPLSAVADVLYSSCALHRIPRPERAARFAYFRSRTSPGGLHAWCVFVPPAADETLPGPEEGASFFEPGELGEYYPDWQVLEGGSATFPCACRDPPHRHRVETVIARGPA